MNNAWIKRVFDPSQPAIVATSAAADLRIVERVDGSVVLELGPGDQIGADMIVLSPENARRVWRCLKAIEDRRNAIP